MLAMTGTEPTPGSEAALGTLLIEIGALANSAGASAGMAGDVGKSGIPLGGASGSAGPLGAAL
jgi:hypothetical protein